MGPGVMWHSVPTDVTACLHAFAGFMMPNLGSIVGVQ